jgi:hypothetical protein
MKKKLINLEKNIKSFKNETRKKICFSTGVVKLSKIMITKLFICRK